MMLYTTGLVYSHKDADGMRLLLDNPSPYDTQLDRGIPVSLFIAPQFHT